MSQEPHSGSRADWGHMIETMHARNWHRRHQSPSVLLARRERMWRLLDRQAPSPGMSDMVWPGPLFDD